MRVTATVNMSIEAVRRDITWEDKIAYLVRLITKKKHLQVTSDAGIPSSTTKVAQFCSWRMSSMHGYIDILLRWNWATSRASNVVKTFRRTEFHPQRPLARETVLMTRVTVSWFPKVE